MSKKNITTASTIAATMTAAEFKQKSYDAYMPMLNSLRARSLSSKPWKRCLRSCLPMALL